MTVDCGLAAVVRPRGGARAALSLWVAIGIAAGSGRATAQTSTANTVSPPMTFERALERAREQAARVVAAHIALDDADARVALASRRLSTNPGVEALVGGSGNSSGAGSGGSGAGAAEITVTQPIDIGARRTARIAGAQSAIALDRARATDLTRTWIRDAALAFVRALHADTRERLLAAAEQTADAFLTVAQRRYAAGDVAILDVNVARAALARARADRRAAAADRTIMLGDLRRQLGLTSDAPLAIEGRLESLADATFDPATLTPAVLDAHPALAPARAELADAEAALAAARAVARPELGGVTKYVRDQGGNTWLGGVALTLPLATRGREQQAIASARVTRARLALDLDRQQLDLEVGTAVEAHRQRIDAARLLERDALPSVDENDALARRSYEAGELALTDSLLIRQQALETRLSYTDRLLDAAASSVLAQAVAGVLR